MKSRTCFQNAVFTALVGAQFLQCAFTTPDLAFVGYNAGINIFQFVVILELDGLEEIKFTDNGVTSGGSFRLGEGVLTWTAPDNEVPSGTVITVNFSGATPLADAGSIVEEESGFFLSEDGDSLIAFTGNLADPLFIAAFNNNGNGVFQADATDDSECALPPGLVINEDAVAVQERDHVVYSGSTEEEFDTLVSQLFINSNYFGSDAISFLALDTDLTFLTDSPTAAPTTVPTSSPTDNPTTAPSTAPTLNPTVSPTKSPTPPTEAPTDAPTDVPTLKPTEAPVIAPTIAPTESPVSSAASEGAGLSDAEILGIAVGCLVGIAILLALLIEGCKKKKPKADEQAENAEEKEKEKDLEAKPSEDQPSIVEVQDENADVADVETGKKDDSV